MIRWFLSDGQRFPVSALPIQTTAGAVSFVDINAIPIAAIDRIDFLNDGGSATYGSDAVAGVVNVILKDEYNGAASCITMVSAREGISKFITPLLQVVLHKV